MNRHIAAFVILLASASVCHAQARQWTDVTGKFSVEAQFVELKDGQVRLRKTDGQEITVPLKKLSPTDRQLAKDEAWLRAASKPKQTPPVKMPPTRNGGPLEFQEPGSHGGFFSFAFSPDGKIVAGGTGVVKEGSSGKVLAGGEVVFWSTSTGRLVRTLGSHGESVTWMAYSCDGAKLASVSEDNRLLKLWSVADGRVEQTRNLPIEVGRIQQLILSPDGSTVVLVVMKPVPDGSVSEIESVVWDIRAGEVKWRLPPSNASAVALSPDGSTVAAHIRTVADRRVVSQEVQLFNAQTGKVVGEIDSGRRGLGNYLVFLPDGKTLAGVARMKRQMVLFWDISTGELTRELDLPSDSSYRAMVFSPDGATMVIPDFMGKGVEVWDLASGAPKGKLSFEFPKTIYHPTFSPDLSRMACNQQNPKMLDLTKLEPLKAPPPRQDDQANSRSTQNTSSGTGSSSPKPSGPPDLQVAEVELKEKWVRAIVKNAGGTVATGIVVTILVDGRQGAARHALTLLPGKEVFVVATHLRQGNHVYKVVIDPDNKIQESDETNNSKEVTLSMPR